MSLRAMVWALNQTTGSPVSKLILVKIGDNANDQGLAWPSIKTISRQCEVDRSTVLRHIKKLVERGLLKIIHRSHEGVSLSNHYLLNLEGKAQQEGEGDGGGCSVPGGGADCDGGGCSVPPGVGADCDGGGCQKRHKPVNEPVSESPPPPGGGVPQKITEEDLEEIVEASLLAEKNSGNSIKNLAVWKQKVRERVVREGVNAIDEENLELLRRMKARIAKEQAKPNQLPERDPEFGKKLQAAAAAVGIEVAA